MKSITLTVLLCFLHVTTGGRILAILPSLSSSHQMWNRALINELCTRGHEITVLSPNKGNEQESKIKEILIEDAHKMVNLEFLDEELAEKSYYGIMSELWDRSIRICSHHLQTKGALKLLNMSPDSFDLIIIETILNDCFNLFLHHFGGGTRIPVVGLTAIGTGPWTDKISRSRTLPSVNPLPILPYSTRMSIWERFHNALLTVAISAGMSTYYFPSHQRIANEVYGKPLPPLDDLGSNISVILANNHFSIYEPLPSVPGIIEVAGMHCLPAKPLPLNVLKFVDGATKGIIYLSFGSALHSHNISKEKLQYIMEALSSLGPNIRILWKYESSTTLEGLPKNVLVQKWFPQQDILGHHKTLMFITHGGLLSMQEAIFHGIPVVGIPFTGYQDRYVKSLVSLGVAFQLDFASLTKETLINAVETILADNRFRRKMHKLSSIFRDQPDHPLDRAVFWTEYSLRHGAGRVEHIRSATADISWLAYYMIDIMMLLALFSLLILATLCYAYHKVTIILNSHDKAGVKYKNLKKKK
ncbi:UDP-glycosyltransferase [Ladona fulva]|uniref:UDP-glycosyltransferase n=1 Tax=Ladona fulva TaxID=123851 RepID=A0A8K0KN85_LADFU|nr:UDP-glycosyltransferase [Ladona fulva]